MALTHWSPLLSLLTWWVQVSFCFALQRKTYDFSKTVSKGTVLSQIKGLRSWIGSAELCYWVWIGVNECHSCKKLLNDSCLWTRQTKSRRWQPKQKVKSAWKTWSQYRCFFPFILCIIKWGEDLYLCEKWAGELISISVESYTWHIALLLSLLPSAVSFG